MLNLTKKERIKLVHRRNFLGYKILSETITEQEKIELKKIASILDNPKLEENIKHAE